MQTIDSLIDGRTKTIDLPPGGEVRLDGESPNYHVLDGFLYSPLNSVNPLTSSKWSCDDQLPPISLADLPQVALRMFFGAFFRSLDDSTQAVRPEDYFNALGDPENWMAFESTPLTLDQIRKSNVEELLTHFAYGVTPAESWDDAVVDQLSRFKFLGSSLDALRTGIIESTTARSKTQIESAIGRSLGRKSTQTVKQGLEHLTEKQYEAAEMYVIKGLTMEQIGSKLGITKQAVEKRIRSVRDKCPEFERQMEVLQRGLQRNRLQYEDGTGSVGFAADDDDEY